MADSPGEERSLPYSQRPEWSDVEPVPQDDGPEPLAVIRYPPGFEEAHDYFRAIQKRNEFSERALQLTADVIDHNSANYTAWYYRRRCLKELGADLVAEHIFTDKWSRDCPKNYQVWYHRRWLVTEMASELRSKSSSPEDAEAEIRALAERELEYHLDTMQVNDDYKNYNGWSHRQFIVHKFGLWDKEMAFVTDLLRDDVRNNSAWNHRYTTVRNTMWPLTDAGRRQEIDFTLQALRGCANNESAWNYLAAFFGEGEGRVAWDSEPAVEAFCREVLAQASERQQLCRFALEVLAQVHEARREFPEALEQYKLLKETDKIRFNYWEWRAATLRQKSGQGA
mmetsp:Transcript_85653/g.277429  ORF Transcript_85653/g.277429 Transcript_85653/m.277429 type:complete len:339 (-) Transcript_85653:179-1195(-)